MDKINLTSIVGNLFVLPMVPLLMIGSMIQIFVPSYISEWTLWVLERLTDWINFVANTTVKYGLVISSDDLWVKYLLIGMIIVVLIVYHLKFSDQTTMSSDVNHKKKKRQAIKTDIHNYG